MLRILLLSLCALVVCQGRNVVREKREARLRKKSMPLEEPASESMPSDGSPTGSWVSGDYVSGSYPVSEGFFSGSYVSEGFFSGSYVSDYFSDWFSAFPSEEPSEGSDPIDDSTFRRVAHQVASMFDGAWNVFNGEEGADAENAMGRELHF